MAVAYESDGGTVFCAANNNNAVSVLLPATRPVGSVLLLVAFNRLITATVSTAPSGYTLASNYPITSGTASGGRMWLYYRVVDGTESAPSIALTGTTGTSGDIWGACIYCYSGVEVVGGVPTISPGGAATPTDAAGTTTCTYPAITTAQANAMVVRFLCRFRDAVDTFTPTASPTHTEREDAGTTTRLGGQHHLQDMTAGAAGSQASVTVAPSNTTSSRYLAQSISLKVAPVPVDAAALTLDWDTVAEVAGPVLSLLSDVSASVDGIVLDLKWDLAGPSVPARYFDDVDDYVQASIGSASQTGAFSLAALVRTHVTGELHPTVGVCDSANAIRFGVEVTTLNGFAARLANVQRTPANFAMPVSPSDGWVLLVVCKAAGTATARMHLFKAGSWIHDDANLPTADQPVQDKVVFGRLGATATYADIDLALAAVWSTALSDAQVESLATDKESRDWLALSPAALWQFTEDPSVSLLDRTGNGANQSAITGTTLLDTGPAGWNFNLPVDGAALDLVWDLTAGVAPVDGAVLDLTWDTPAEATGIVLDLPWDLRSEVVGAVDELIWDLRVQVDGAVEDLLWDTRTQVDGGVEDLVWDLRGEVSGAVDELIWDLKAEVSGGVLDLVWDLAGPSVAPVDGPVLDLQWDTVAQVSSPVEDLVWDLRSEVSGGVEEFVWDTRAQVDGVVEDLKWDLAGQVSSAQQRLVWDLRGVIDGAVLDLLWDLAAFGAVNAAPISLLWDLRASVNGAVEDLLWDLRSEANGPVEDLVWDLRAEASGGVLDLPWDLRVLVNGAVEDLIWDLRSEANGGVLDLPWELRAEANAAARTLKWDLVAQINSAQERLIWDLRAVVDATVLDLIWDLVTFGQVNAQPVSLLWDLRAAVSAAGLDALEWDIYVTVAGAVEELVWDTRAAVNAAARALKWDLVAAVNSAQYELVWDLNLAVTAAQLRAVWDLTNGVAGTVLDLTWDLWAGLARTLVLIWDVDVPPATRFARIEFDTDSVVDRADTSLAAPGRLTTTEASGRATALLSAAGLSVAAMGDQLTAAVLSEILTTLTLVRPDTQATVLEVRLVVARRSQTSLVLNNNNGSRDLDVAVRATSLLLDREDTETLVGEDITTGTSVREETEIT